MNALTQRVAEMEDYIDQQKVVTIFWGGASTSVAHVSRPLSQFYALDVYYLDDSTMCHIPAANGTNVSGSVKVTINESDGGFDVSAGHAVGGFLYSVYRIDGYTFIGQ